MSAVRLPIVDGMVPDNWLLFICISFSAVRIPIVDGMVPDN